MDISFQNENNVLENIPEELPKNPYITKDHVPEMEIINENIVICDKKEYDIKYYNKIINNNSDEFLDDVEIYNHCGKCKKEFNIYFCKDCHLNICVKCYEKCNKEKHNFINLDKMKEEFKSYLAIIKYFLNHNIIPIEEFKENSIKGENN